MTWPNLKTLHRVGLLEALSFVLLLGIAMPLKYIWGKPEAVSVIGMAHGVLWILYIGLVGWAHLKFKWGFRLSIILFIASFLPLGPIIAERKWIKPRFSDSAN